MKCLKAILCEAQAEAMLHSLNAQHRRFGILWRFGVETGLRISDILALRAGDLRDQLARRSPISVVEKKTGKAKSFTVSPKLANDMLSLIVVHALKPTDYVFFSSASKKHKPMSRQWASRLIALTARNRGLESIGAHSMRKMYACNLYLSTGQIRAVQEALNHKYASTTLIYLKDLLPTMIPEEG